MSNAGPEDIAAMRPDYELAREKLDNLMRDKGLQISSEFIPWSKSRNAPGRYDAGPRPHGDHAAQAQWEKMRRNGWRSLNWLVKLDQLRSAPQRREPILATEYSAGEGHCPAVKHMAKKGPDHRRPHCLDWEAAVKFELESGKPYNFRMSHLSNGPTGKNMKIEPDAVDVFASMVRDGRDAIESGSFEDWARDLGYDVDSRKAAAVFDECLKHGLALRKALGEAILNEAADLASQL